MSRIGVSDLGTFGLMVGAFTFGLVVGTLMMVALYRFRRPEASPTPWIATILFCAAVIGVAAVGADDFKFWQAMMVLLIGGPALIAAARAIELIARGETIEMQSQWGGLGGALGGWRLSPVTSLVLLALVFMGAAVSVAVPLKPADNSDTKSVSSKTIATSGETGNQKQPVKPESAKLKASENDAKPTPTSK